MVKKISYFLLVGIGCKQLLKPQDDNTEIQTINTHVLESSHPNKIFSFLSTVLHPNTYNVAAVTVANLLSLQAKIDYILSRYGKTCVPLVLIGLGLFIMYERGTFNIIKSLSRY